MNDTVYVIFYLNERPFAIHQGWFNTIDDFKENELHNLLNLNTRSRIFTDLDYTPYISIEWEPDLGNIRKPIFYGTDFDEAVTKIMRFWNGLRAVAVEPNGDEEDIYPIEAIFKRKRVTRKFVRARLSIPFCEEGGL